jgi:hypothetical protein
MPRTAFRCEKMSDVSTICVLDLPLPVQLFDYLCLAYVAPHRYVSLFTPSLQWVPPLAVGTPCRGSVRLPWDTLVSLGTWFTSGWADVPANALFASVKTMCPQMRFLDRI